MRKLTPVLAVIAATVLPAGAASADSHCTDVGTEGLTTDYVNEVPDEPFDVACDIGIYFDEDATVDGLVLAGTVANARSTQFGIVVDDAEVDLTNAAVMVEAGFPGQFVSVAYRNGATGAVHGNELTGAHRVALLIRGAGTVVAVQNNTIEGTGAKTSGWAENGIQVDQGAQSAIVNNTVSGHWWDGESNWASAGILLFASDSTLKSNVLNDNEFGVYASGDGNRLRGNSISSSVVSSSSFDFRAYGILVAGSGNDLSGNVITESNDDGAVGVYVYAGSEDNKITGNRVRGFEHAVVDGGSDNFVRGPSVGGA